MKDDDAIYSGGIKSVLLSFDARRRPFDAPFDVLPTVDADLTALLKTPLAPPTEPMPRSTRRSIAFKRASLQKELAGKTELHLLHAMLIAILRRRRPPAEAALLFHRIWGELGHEFVKDLPTRWQISAATTFADHGQTADQRACGMGLSVLFDLIKLHDSERRFSGQPNSISFTRKRRMKNRDSLAFDLSPYSFKGGGLDRNMLSRLWKICERDPTIAPLGFHMLNQVMRDKRSIFARVQQIKRASKTSTQAVSAPADTTHTQDQPVPQPESAKTPTWGVVSTIRAPARDILNFAAHHIDLGADYVHIYLDQANPAAQEALAAHPKCRVSLTDDAYWQSHGGRPDMHQPRQTLNATHCYGRNPPVDWLLHADADEFLWTANASLSQCLATLPDAIPVARIRPVESMAPDPADPPPEGALWCKGCAPDRLTRTAETQQIYSRLGQYLSGGFLSHVQGKILVRTGIEGINLRIHNAFLGKEKITDGIDLKDFYLCHLHAPSLEEWLETYRFRLQKGSYRPELQALAGPSGYELTINQLFSTLEEDAGEAALRRFFHETCVATPGLRSRLERFGHLHQITLDLDTKRARHFPDHA